MSEALERRRAHRVSCAASVHDIGSDTPCRATNISETGLYLRRLEGGIFLEGERVALQLQLFESEPPIWIAGRVVEQVEEVLYDGAAVRFDVVPGADRARIRRFVEHARRERARAALAGLGAERATTPFVPDPLERAPRRLRRAA